MRKSLSKLLVATMTLSLSLGIANAQTLTKSAFSSLDASGTLSSADARVTETTTTHRLQPSIRTTAKATNPLSQSTVVSQTAARNVLPALNAPYQLGANPADLYGSVIYADSWVDTYNQWGIYSIPTNGDPDINYCLASGSNYNVNSGGCYAEGKYYFTYYLSFWGMTFLSHYIYDATTWELLESVTNDNYNSCATDVTYDPTTGRIYGCFFSNDGSSYVFGYQELGTFNTIELSNLGSVKFSGIAATNEGKIYGLTVDGNLYEFDKQTGATTLIGSTGVYSPYDTSATYDRKSGLIYWTVSDNAGGYLYTVDPATASAQMVAEFSDGQQVTGLYIPTPSTEDGAPAAVEELNVATEGTLRTTTVSFKLPTKTFDESSNLFGQLLDYCILRNGEEIYSNNGVAGTAVEYLDVVPASGNYTYTAYAINGQGMGAKSEVSLFVGTDTPVSPQNVVLNYDNGEVTLTWDPVEIGAQGGQLGGTPLYKVSKILNGMQVEFADGITDTYYVANIGEPDNLTTIYYVVEAYEGYRISEPGISNTIVLGHATAPYREEFESADNFKAYTVIDVNEDDRTWTFNGGNIYIPYHGSNDMNDWLITPGIELKAGKIYEFYYSAAPSSTFYIESLEVAMGTAPTVEGMSDIIQPKFDLQNSTDQQEYRIEVKPETDGIYYFGIHGVSGADRFYIYVDYLGITEGLSADAPAAAALDVTADPSGAKKATVTYTVPSTTLEGNPTRVVFCELYRDGALLKKTDFPAAGEEVTYEDEVEYDGVYEYSVVAYNTNGEGATATLSRYIGINIAAAPENVKVVETGNTGEVTITWDAPATDINGYPINPENITYMVVSASNEVIAENIDELTLTYQAVDGDQRFVQFAVFAITAAGVSEPGMSDMIACGTPYQMPMEESLAGGYLNHILGVWEMVPTAAWGVYGDNYFIDVTSSDYDGAFLGMKGDNYGAKAALITGKVEVTGESPVISFDLYSHGNEDANPVEVAVNVPGTDELVTIASTTCANEEAGWHKFSADLKDYIGKTVQFYIISGVESYYFTFIDNLRIYQPAAYDLEAVKISAPGTAKSGQEFFIEVTVGNYGLNTVDAYTVELYKNDELVATTEAGPIAVYEEATVGFNYALSSVDANTNAFSAKVVYADDTVADNNTTGYTTVALTIMNLPAPSNLVATQENGGVNLTWDEPDFSATPDAVVTDDFESYEPFTCGNVGDWTLVDMDQEPTGGISGITIPGVEVGTTRLSYVLINTVDLGVSELQGYEAASGVQYMMSFFLTSGKQNSDWMISPILSGAAQTISFNAKSFSADYPESFKVHYSTTNADVESFVEVASYENIPGDWTEYTIDLPEGAKYFAIENCGTDRFALCVDDVTYCPGVKEYTLLGYNVYRNGVKLNETAVADANYFDAEGTSEDVYMVTAVYTEGESAAATAAQQKPLGVESAVASAANINVVAREIVVSGAQGMVSVLTADGKMLYNSAAKATNTITVAPGVYVVTAGKQTQKVIVK